jgi:hypothetical protein
MAYSNTLLESSDEQNQDSKTQQNQDSKTHFSSAEVIRAFTPMLLAIIGGIIGITTLMMGADPAGFGLASTTIAGAAGLAQPGKNPSQKDKS